jgi:hypothetical protein
MHAYLTANVGIFFVGFSDGQAINMIVVNLCKLTPNKAATVRTRLQTKRKPSLDHKDRSDLFEIWQASEPCATSEDNQQHVVICLCLLVHDTS